MVRLLAAAAVLACALSAWAAPITRWTSEPLEGAARLVAGGPRNATLVVLRQNLDPIRSFDGGQTWSPFRVRGERPLDLSISPTDGMTWYAVLTPDPILASSPRTILRSQDGGSTWEERSQVTARYPLAPVVGADPDTLYLAAFDLPFCGFLCEGTSAHVLASRDGGRTWADPAPDLRALKLVASAADSRVAYVASIAEFPGVVRRTSDGGATWTTIRFPLPNPANGATHVSLYNAEIALDRKDARIAYLRPEQPFGYPAENLYVTRDGGESWSTQQLPTGRIVTDPVMAGYAYLHAFDGRLMETRDAGRTWATVDAGTAPPNRFFTIIPETPIAVTWRDDRRVAVGIDTSAKRLGRLDLTHGALAIGADLWWDPAQPGSGLSITQHPSGNTFVVWYTYGADGAPVWRVVSGGTWQDRTLSGAMYETTGPAFFRGPFDPARVTLREVGTATLTFDDESNASFTYRLGAAQAASQRITRQVFAERRNPAAETHADLYWNAAESGWGLAVSHQGQRLFATWFTYGDDGRPLWLVASDLTLSTEFVGLMQVPFASGDLYITRSPGAGAAPVYTNAGRAKLLLRLDGGVNLEYSAFGRTETRELTRQPF